MVMSDRIALLRMGELEQVASPREIYSRPATAYTAQFIGHTNLLRTTVQGESFAAVPFVPAPFRMVQPCFSAAENIRLAGSSGTHEAVRFRGHLKHRAFHGSTELLQIEAQTG